MPVNYSISYRKVNVAVLDSDGEKQYDEHGVLITEPIYKAYANAQSLENLDTKQFAKSCISTGSVLWSTADIIAMLDDILGAMESMLLQGMRIEFGDMGTFYPSLSSKGCAVDDQWVASAYIKKAYASWLRPTEMKDFKEECTFQLVNTRGTESALVKMNKAGESSTTIPISQSAYEASQSGQVDILPEGKFRLTVKSLDEAKGSVSGGGIFEPGDVPTFTASAKTGSHFVGWIKDGKIISTSPNAYYVMGQASVTIYALFELNGQTTGHTVEVSTDDSSMGGVTGGGFIPNSNSCTIVATPNRGYVFDYWEDEEGETYDDATYTFTPTANRKFTAYFDVE